MNLVAQPVCLTYISQSYSSSGLNSNLHHSTDYGLNQEILTCSLEEDLVGIQNTFYLNGN